ncbi:MAG: hypothetical protein Q7S37_05450 [bacterium]|nr:hypothetical protein [bacterium]
MRYEDADDTEDRYTKLEREAEEAFDGSIVEEYLGEDEAAEYLGTSIEGVRQLRKLQFTKWSDGGEIAMSSLVAFKYVYLSFLTRDLEKEGWMDQKTVVSVIHKAKLAALVSEGKIEVVDRFGFAFYCWEDVEKYVGVMPAQGRPRKSRRKQSYRREVAAESKPTKPAIGTVGDVSSGQKPQKTSLNYCELGRKLAQDMGSPVPISRITIRGWVKSGKVSVVEVRGRRRVLVSEYEKCLELAKSSRRHVTKTYR